MNGLKVLAELAMSISVGYITEDAIKMVTPKNLTGAKAFGAKVGTAMVGSIVGGFVTEIVSRNVSEIVSTVKSVGEESAEKFNTEE